MKVESVKENMAFKQAPLRIVGVGADRTDYKRGTSVQSKERNRFWMPSQQWWLYWGKPVQRSRFCGIEAAKEHSQSNAFWNVQTSDRDNAHAWTGTEYTTMKCWAVQGRAARRTALAHSLRPTVPCPQAPSTEPRSHPHSKLITNNNDR